MIGRTLAHYRITAAIGAGGMGQVYRATDTKLGRDVALKILPAELASSAEMTERFRREARAVAALNHPNIVTIHSVEEADGFHFLTMELVEGRSLDRLIPEGGLEAPRILEIAKALSGALAEAHDKGIVHRDLKPANVMVTDDGGVKVLDFGLAKFQGPTAMGADSEVSTAMKTDAGVIMGTRPYMSPEQVQGRVLDARSDIFSMGVVLYEISTGKRPFHGQSGADLFASILRDPVPPVTEARADLPADLSRVIRRCLEKDPRHRMQTARDIGNELRDALRSSSETTRIEPARAAAGEGSGPSGSDQGFRVAVLPFKYTGSDADITALAEGLSEGIVSGLAHFSYLRVIARSATSRFGGGDTDQRTVATEIGARYLIEGSLRQAGSALRVSAKLLDTASGVHLWAENYDRPFRAEDIFKLHDDLVPRVVSTVADWYGVLPHSMSEALRSRNPEQLSPYEAVLRSFGYGYRRTPEEHAVVRAGLERAVQQAPDYADGWAMLSFSCSEEYAFGFNAMPDPLDRTLRAAQRAIDSEPLNALAHNALARALFFRKEFQAFRIAAERAMELQPMNGATLVLLGTMIAYAGDWDHGCALVEKGAQLNPRHPGWHLYPLFYNAYRKGDYRGALNTALRINQPHFYRTHVFTSATHGQLGERDAAQKALRELLRLRPDFAATARAEFTMWYDAELVEHLIEGLRKAGLAIAPAEAQPTPLLPAGTAKGHLASASASAAQVGAAEVAIAVLPFSDLSPGKDHEYLCEGMAEEVMSALMGIEGLRVASRTSTFRARQGNSDLAALARVLSVSHVLEGSVRTAGGRLRVTAQLTDVATGFQLWSERFDREATDVFAVQDEISAGVVEAVRARLAPGASAIHARRQPRNLEAYRSFLKGRHLRGKEDNVGAMAAYEEAIRLDPSHAPSWTGLAESTVLAAHFNIIPAREACAAARRAVLAAVELEGESANTRHVEAFIAFLERRWPEMEAAWRRAIELQPTHVLALGSFGISLCARERFDEGLALLAQAREIDPLASFPCMLIGFGLLERGRAEDGQRYLADALSFEKEDAAALYISAAALVALGRAEESIAPIRHAVEITARAAHFVGVLGWALATAGRKEEARVLLDELRTRPTEAPAVTAEAWLLGALGEVDSAFEVIARAEKENQANLYYTGFPGFDTLRADPRFAELRERLGLRPERTS